MFPSSLFQITARAHIRLAECRTNFCWKVCLFVSSLKTPPLILSSQLNQTKDEEDRAFMLQRFYFVNDRWNGQDVAPHCYSLTVLRALTGLQVIGIKLCTWAVPRISMLPHCSVRYRRGDLKGHWKKKIIWTSFHIAAFHRVKCCNSWFCETPSEATWESANRKTY